jgi:hypothetical protein
MSAIILKFPVRESVRIRHDSSGDGWIVVTHRGHGWLHGGFQDAFRDAVVVAAGYGVSVISSAGIAP